ncbi:F163B protein, partial [Grantiella picta]|nr:F163B protein [Grantiella picta]
MTAGTVVITGGILATVILLCIIAVLCYCRLQYYCCKKDESEEDEEEPDFAVHSHIPPLHCNRNVVLTNGPSLYSSSPFAKKPAQSRPSCPSWPTTSFLQEPPTSFLQEPPTFFLQEPPEELHNGGDRVSYKTVSQEDLALPVSNLQALNPNRLSAMREAFSRSRSISTDV